MNSLAHLPVLTAAVLVCVGCGSREEFRGSESTARARSSVCESVTIPFVHVLRVPFYPILLMGDETWTISLRWTERPACNPIDIGCARFQTLIVEHRLALLIAGAREQR